jgi:hypothetical protein
MAFMLSARSAPDQKHALGPLVLCGLWHWFPIRTAARHQHPCDPRYLVCHSDGGDLGRALQKLEQPGPTRTVTLSVTDNGKTTDDE